MSYTYNKMAFGAVSTLGTGQPALLESYCLCVKIELALKEYLNFINTNQNGGHDIPALLQALSGNLQGPNRASCNAFIAQYQTSINGIWCQDQYGVARRVPRKSYPYIRYIRHNSDWASSSTADIYLENFKTTVRAIHNFLQVSTGVII